MRNPWMLLVLIKFSQLVKRLESSNRIPIESYGGKRRKASIERGFSREFRGWRPVKNHDSVEGDRRRRNHLASAARVS